MKKEIIKILMVFFLVLKTTILFSFSEKSSLLSKDLASLKISTNKINPAVNDISLLPKNTIVPLINDTTNFTSLTVTGTEFCPIIGSCIDDWTGNGANVIDGDTDNFSRASILLGGDAEVLSITYPTEDIPAGSYAGFRIRNASLLSLLSNNTAIRTRDVNGDIVDTYNLEGSLISALDFSNATNVGFVTTGNFRTIEIVFGGDLLKTGSLDVFYPFIKLYQENSTSLTCNDVNTITNPQFPVEVVDVGVTGVNVSLLGDVIQNQEFLIDSDLTNHATLNAGLVGVGVLATSYISIAKQADFSTGVVTPFSSNTYAGFNITSANLLTADVIGNITISTYLDNVFQEDNSNYNALVNLPLLSSDTQNVGFVTTKPYDEIRITVSQPIGVNLGEIQVNYPVVKKYCVSNPFNCNEQVSWVNSNHPVEISTVNSNGLVAAGGTIDNIDNIINSDTTDYAEIDLSVGVISSLEIGVYDVLQEYSGPQFVGFEIETATLLDVNLLNNISLSTYLNGVATGDSVSGANILLSAPLLVGLNKQTIGMVTSNIFDEVRLEFNTTVGANLGVFRIYNSTIKKLCTKELACSETYYLNSPEFSTYVDYSKSGVSGLVCVGCNVSNTDAVLSASNSDFASINITAGVAATGSLAVRDATNAYPANSTAGFVVKSNSSIVEVSLFDSITIETLDQNGNVLESASGSDLIDLTVLINLLGGTPNGIYNLGFETTQKYYGIQITVAKLVDVNTNLDLTDNNDLDIYGAFVDTRGATGAGFEFCLDTDKDTVLDVNDLDDDNDGIIDAEENGGINPILDSDGDTILDYKDSDTPGFVDSNLDGVDDRFDLDLDGIIDQHDTDADGDGCPDAIEGAGNFIFDDLVNNNFGTIAETSVGTSLGIPLLNGVLASQSITPAVRDNLDNYSCFIDLSIIKTVENPVVKLGETVIFNITITNNGGLIANNVVVKDVLPEGLTYNESSSSIPNNTLYNPETGLWSFGTVQIKQGESFTLKLASNIIEKGILKINKTEVFTFNNAQNEFDSIANSDD